jgi:hypothetical protein
VVDGESGDTACRPVSRRRGDSVAIGRIAWRLEVIRRHYGIVRVKLIGTEPRSAPAALFEIHGWSVWTLDHTGDAAAERFSRSDGSAAY